MKKSLVKIVPNRLVSRMAALSVAAAAMLLSGGCAINYSSPVQPPLGGIFTKVSAPMTVDFEGQPTKTTEGNALKQGSVNTSYIRIPLFINPDFAWGESAVAEAARDGRISTVHYADYEFLQVIGLYAQYEVTAYGE